MNNRFGDAWVSRVLSAPPMPDAKARHGVMVEYPVRQECEVGVSY